MFEKQGQFEILTKTNVNAEKDFKDIRDRLKAYGALCDSQAHLEKIHTQCIKRMEEAKQLVFQMENEVSQDLNNLSRKRRNFIGAAARVAAKAEAKVGSTILSGSAKKVLLN